MTVAAARPFRWPVRVYYEDTDAAGVDALDVTLACLYPNTWRPTHIPAPLLARMEVSA
jgi:acyl-CoA thioesterase FadM